MKATIEKFFSSYVTMIVLLILYAVLLGTATFIEKYQGTVMAKTLVYYSPVFFLLQFLMIINFIVILLRHQLLKKRKWGFLVLHVAFIIILLGALVSHIFGEEGILHLREGETSNQLVVQTSKGTHIHALPFDVELIQFTMTRYPGSSSPSSYESDLLFHVEGETQRHLVFMNNVVDMKGYRFFQASYDRDEMGTILSVNRDVAGRNITYTGYVLLVLGFILCLIGKHSRFRQLARQLKEIRHSGKMMIGFCGLLISGTMYAHPENMPMLEAIQRYTVDPVHAAKFGALPVQSGRGRMMPVNTFSSEILRKLHKADKIGNMNSDQFLLSLISLSDMWMRVPFITYSGKEIELYYDLTAKECAYVEMFDSNGNYKLHERLESAYNKMPAQRNSFDKEIIKLDEKVNILFQLFNEGMLNLFPLEGDPNDKWYAPGEDLSGFAGQDSLFMSRIMEWYVTEIQNGMKTGDWSQADEVLGMIETYQQGKNKTLAIDLKRLEMEIRYNQLEIFWYCKIIYLILGSFLLILSFVSLFKERIWLTWGLRLLGVGVLACFCFQMVGMGMRWYIGGYAPWSNSYETMVYVAWATVAGGILFGRRSMITFALATLFAGIILFVSGLNWMDPQINTLVPVLKSPWLMFHVAVIVAAYGFFGISFLIGITHMILMIMGKPQHTPVISFRVKELTIVNEMSLIVGLALMTIGTFLGAVWANESWGRYWGWDPKETWALVTVIVYGIVIHLRLVKKLYSAWLFNLSSVIAFASVIMTFFGVNYFLSGMHSYGQNDNAGNILRIMYLAIAIVAVLGILSYKKSR
ncbi:MAG: cytochrome c biogenesis protein CcsA [Tannerellaceae bacterium]|nr:cytochrome c biogenesis protein CcsA [Tannerellaceae bacterium]